MSSHMQAWIAAEMHSKVLEALRQLIKRLEVSESGVGNHEAALAPLAGVFVSVLDRKGIS